MVYTRFEQLTQAVASRPQKARCPVVAAEDERTIDAVVRAYREGLIEPILIGDENVINEMLADRYFDSHQVTILHEQDHEKAAQLAIDMVNAGVADCIMKGLIHTNQFMHAVLKRDNHLRTGQLVSMLSIRELPYYHKLIAFTDGGICMHPTLDEKRQIIENAVAALLAMGYDTPKVGVLAAVEEPNPKMPEIIRNCIVEGPISYDIAINAEAAKLKGFDSPVAGDPDLLVFPDLAAANIATKAITQTCRIPVGSLILGIKVPIILPSRAALTETKYMCIALAAAANMH